MQYLEALAQTLAGFAPEETILVCANRMEGRRLLAACARRQTLVGVRAETPWTLALEVSTTEIGGKPIASADECARIFMSLPEGSKGPFSSGNSCRYSEAQRFLRELDEIYFYNAAQALQKSGNPKFQALFQLFQANSKQRAEAGLLSRTGIFQAACSLAAKGNRASQQLKKAHFVLVPWLELRPKEEELISALSGGKAVRLPLSEAQNRPQNLHFAACRGAEAEVAFALREVQKHRLEDCAIVCMEQSYFDKVYSAANRAGIPLTMQCGVPFSHSRTFRALEVLEALPAEDYPAELLCELLRHCGALAPKLAQSFAGWLEKSKIGWGTQERYGYFLAQWKAEAPDFAEQIDSCCAWLEQVFALEKPAQLSEQKARLKALLACFDRSRELERAALAETERTVDNLYSLPQGQTLLRHLAQVLGGQPVCRENAAPGKLFCTGLDDALSVDRPYLYLLGCSRDCLQSGCAESPILLDADRTALNQKYGLLLPCSTDREAHNRKTVTNLLENYPGNLTLTYPDYDTAHLTELPPAVFYRGLLEQSGAQEEKIGILPRTPLTQGDYIAAVKNISLVPPQAKAANDTEPAKLAPEKSLQEALENHVFSPSQLETAFRCPFVFYLQTHLHIYPPEKRERQDRCWLPANEMGTVCHAVLEHYYAKLKENATMPLSDRENLLHELMEEEFEEAGRRLPPVAARLVQRDRERAETMIRAAIGWTAAAGHAPEQMEWSFDTSKGAGLQPLQIGDIPIHLRGTIDRVDTLPDGSQAIIDYKTGDPEKMRREQALHLQHTLYSQVWAQKSGQVPSEAGYLMLRTPVTYLKNENSSEADEAKIAEILDEMTDEDRALACGVQFSYENGFLLQYSADEIEKTDITKDCQRYCKYRALCVLGK